MHPKEIEELLQQHAIASTIIIDLFDDESRHSITTRLEYSFPRCRIIGVSWKDNGEGWITLKNTDGFEWNEIVRLRHGIAQVLNLSSLVRPLVERLQELSIQLDKTKDAV